MERRPTSHCRGPHITPPFRNHSHPGPLREAQQRSIAGSHTLSVDLPTEVRTIGHQDTGRELEVNLWARRANGSGFKSVLCHPRGVRVSGGLHHIKGPTPPTTGVKMRTGDSTLAASSDPHSVWHTYCWGVVMCGPLFCTFGPHEPVVIPHVQALVRSPHENREMGRNSPTSRDCQCHQ